MFDFNPVEFPFSTVDKMYQLFGNTKAINLIQELTENNIKNNIPLYETQSSIQQQLLCNYGYSEDWYIKNAEAVQFLIENAYANQERKKLPYIDKKAIEEWQHSTNLY